MKEGIERALPGQTNGNHRTAHHTTRTHSPFGNYPRRKDLSLKIDLNLLYQTLIDRLGERLRCFSSKNARYTKEEGP